MAKSIELSQKDIPGGERLADAERPGGPMRFSLEQILQLFAIACEPPEDYGRPISHWTPRELASEMVKGDCQHDSVGRYWQKQISNRTSPSTG